MTMQHTPGPWFVAKADEPMESDGLIVESPNGYEIRPDGHQRLGDELADLSLIAAAPDLLEALTLLIAGIESSVSNTYIPLVKARAAIAKAEGGAA